MKSFGLGRHAFGGGVAVALLAGCGGSPPIGTPSAMLQTSAIASHAYRGTSWVLAEEAGGKSTLLYVGDSNGDTVSVFDYNSGILVGTLTGFNSPAGGCVDARGDVFITNQGSGTTLEFRHGGSKPIRQYTEVPSGVGCSVDRNGDLAVAVQPLSSGGAKLCVWKGGKGSGTCYSDKDCGTMGSPGYDAKGNLYVEGFYYAEDVCELPAGAQAMRTVKVSGGSLNGGPEAGVMWDGRHLTLTGWSSPHSQTTTFIHRVNESPSGDLRIIGTTAFSDTCNGEATAITQPFIVGKKNTPINDREGRTVVGADYICYPVPIDFWHYPDGGTPSKALPLQFYPGGIVVSIGR